MAVPVFVDTNVFVYRHDSSDRVKQSRAERWIAMLANDRTGRLSYQVLQELYTTLTHSRRLNSDPVDARRIIEALSFWQPVQLDLAVLRRAWMAQDRFHLSWWDALIVSAAQVSECPFLLTEDMQDGQLLDDVRVVNPFASPTRSPREVLEAFRI